MAELAQLGLVEAIGLTTVDWPSIIIKQIHDACEAARREERDRAEERLRHMQQAQVERIIAGSPDAAHQYTLAIVQTFGGTIYVDASPIRRQAFAEAAEVDPLEVDCPAFNCGAKALHDCHNTIAPHAERWRSALRTKGEGK